MRRFLIIVLLIPAMAAGLIAAPLNAFIDWYESLG